MTSPPGALSQRTDKQPINVPTGLPYGQAQDLHQLEQASPMAASPPTPSAPPGASQGGSPAPALAAQPTRIHAPTERPDEPVTAGAASGPGPGLEAIQPGQAYGQPAGPGPISQAIARAAAVDTSGTLASLLQVAQQKGL